MRTLFLLSTIFLVSCTTTTVHRDELLIYARSLQKKSFPHVLYSGSDAQFDYFWSEDGSYRVPTGEITIDEPMVMTEDHTLWPVLNADGTIGDILYVPPVEAEDELDATPVSTPTRRLPPPY